MLNVVYAIRMSLHIIFMSVFFFFYWFLVNYGSLFASYFDAVTDERVAPSRKKVMECK